MAWSNHPANTILKELLFKPNSDFFLDNSMFSFQNVYSYCALALVDCLNFAVMLMVVAVNFELIGSF
jgi:hypothetical protein